MKRDFRQQRDNNWTEQRRRDGDQWATPTHENADFEEYYKMQVKPSMQDQVSWVVRRCQAMVGGL
jgi:hypothetical protein